MPTLVHDAVYGELSGDTSLNANPLTPVVVFGDHSTIIGTSGPILIGGLVPNIDRIVVASTSGAYNGTGAIAPGQWVTLTWATYLAPTAWHVQIGSVSDPTSYQVIDGAGDIIANQYTFQMQSYDMVVTISGVGFQSNANFQYSLDIDTTSTVPVLADLTMSSLSAGASTVQVGQNLSISSTISNVGTASANSSLLNYYLSTDGTVAHGTYIGGRSTGTLVAGTNNSYSESFQVLNSIAPGTYYLIAVADRLHHVLETNENNNISSLVPITVVAPPPVLSISATHATTYEGDAGLTPFTFTVSRSGVLSSASSAQWTVTGGTAVAADLGGAFPSGTVSFAAGQSSATITVHVAGDIFRESHETFTIALSNPAGATISAASATGTILDDDGLSPVNLSSSGTVSIPGNNVQGTDSGGAMSADGRYVAFSTSATNFSSLDFNSQMDVYLRDMVTGNTILVSAGSGGIAGNSATFGPYSISADAHYALFRTNATNLLPGGADGDIVLRDLVAGTNARGLPTTYNAVGATLTDDGQHIVFSSSVNNITSGDTDGLEDVFLLDIATGAVRLVSASAPGAASGFSSSTDARAILFASISGANTTYYLSDTVTNTTSVVLGPMTSSSGFASVSGNGRYILINSSAADLVPGDTNNATDVFVRDILLGTTTLASTGDLGQGNAGSNSVSISDDGRYVTFWSLATNFIAGDGDTNGFLDVFVRDMNAGRTVRLSVTNDATSLGTSAYGGTFSGDGRYVTFNTNATTIFRAANPLWRASLSGGPGNDALAGTAQADDVFGLAGGDYLQGNAGSDYLYGGDGNDVLDGGTGFDRLYGGAGADSLWGSYGADNEPDWFYGGTGDDTYFVYQTFDEVYETNATATIGGFDLVYSFSNYTLDTNVEYLTLFGNNAGLNAIAGNTLDNALNAMQYNGGSGINFTDDLGNDVVYGSYYADTISTGRGNDTLWGSWGADGRSDAMTGGDGSDTYFVQEALDTVSETNASTAATEIDTVYSAIDMTLGANLEYLFIYGAATVATGNNLGNAIIGSYSGLQLTLSGLGGPDSITGGGGNDTIDGGAGIDVLFGSGGADTFAFAAGQSSGDIINDFNGAGAGSLDGLRFTGYGPGATFTQINSTQWQVNYGAGLAIHDVITFNNGASIHATDYVFV